MKGNKANDRHSPRYSTENSWGHRSSLRRLDFRPRGRAPEVGHTIERNGGQHAPVRRKGKVDEILPLALLGEQFPVRH